MAKIVQTSKGWRVDYRLGGRRHRIVLPTKQLAYEYLKDIQLRKVDAEFGINPLKKKSLKDAIHEYVELVSTRKSYRTQVLEKQVFERFYEHFGNIHVSDVQLRDLELLQRQLLSKYELTPATVNRYFNVYRNFFSKCEDWNYTKFNPVRRIKNFPIRLTRKRLWTDEEINKLIFASADWLKDIVYLLAHTGMRMGEVCKLKWKHVDFERGILTVSSIKGTGDERVRYIPLLGDLMELFLVKRDWAKRLFKCRDEDCVFLNASQNPTSSTHVSRELARLIRKAGLNGLLAKNLRHTFITHMAGQDQSIEKIRQLAGHTTLRTTENYLHLQDHQMREAMEKAALGRNILPLPKNVGTSGH